MPTIRRKAVTVDFRSDIKAFDALTAGTASMIASDMRHIALNSFQAIVDLSAPGII
jgi:hypothetical protein